MALGHLVNSTFFEPQKLNDSKEWGDVEHHVIWLKANLWNVILPTCNGSVSWSKHQNQ
jgi:hypothetical protein